MYTGEFCEEHTHYSQLGAKGVSRTCGKKNPASGTHDRPVWLLLGIIITRHLTAPSFLLAHCQFTHRTVTPCAHWCLLPACESSSFGLRLPDKTGMHLEPQPVGWSEVFCAYLLWQVKPRNRQKALTLSVWMSVKRENVEVKMSQETAPKLHLSQSGRKDHCAGFYCSTPAHLQRIKRQNVVDTNSAGATLGFITAYYKEEINPLLISGSQSETSSPLCSLHPPEPPWQKLRLGRRKHIPCLPNDWS